MPWTNIPNSVFEAAKPARAIDMRALRDNIPAALRGEALAPVNEYGWHPYNKLITSDANDGTIWSFAVNGAVASVTSPDFAEGYEYAFLCEQVFSTGGTAQSLFVNLYRETSVAYAGAMALSGTNNVSNALSISPWVEMPHVRKTRKSHYVFLPFVASDGADNVLGLASVSGFAQVRHTTAQKILRAQFSLSGGSITGNAASRIQMFKRRAL